MRLLHTHTCTTTTDCKTYNETENEREEKEDRKELLCVLERSPSARRQIAFSQLLSLTGCLSLSCSIYLGQANVVVGLATSVRLLRRYCQIATRTKERKGKAENRSEATVTMASSSVTCTAKETAAPATSLTKQEKKKKAEKADTRVHLSRLMEERKKKPPATSFSLYGSVKTQRGKSQD